MRNENEERKEELDFNGLSLVATYKKVRVSIAISHKDFSLTKY